MNGSDAPPDPAGFTPFDSEQTLRNSAVEKLRILEDLDISTLSPEEIRQRLDELRVHQIELEIQNDNLRQNQVELENTRSRYFNLYDLAPVGYCTLGANGLIQEANLTAATLLGVPRGELTNKPISQLILKEDQDIFSLHRKQLFETDIPQVVELRMVRGDQSLFWARLYATTFRDSTGALVLWVVLTDITDRRQAEEVLREEQWYLRTILQTTPDGFWEVDIKGRITKVNEAYCRMSGYTRNELLNLTISAIDVKDKSTTISARIKRIVAKGSEIFETRHRRKNGSVFPVEVSVTYIHRGHGTFLCFCRDISERRQAEEQLQNINNELERRVEERTRELQETQLQYLHAEKLSAIGKLSASIAHEFNNPLQSIMSVLKGLKKRALLEEEDKELLNAAIDESDRIKKLIRSLQEFNRPSSFRKIVMDVHKSIDSLLLLHKSDFKNKRISVEQHYAERLPQIMAIPDQIKQVILNLLTNAADACQHPGGIITISTWQENERVAISIRDTGVGIQPEHLDTIFQPFYTTKSEVKGTGLGLSVCYGIVKNHQGEFRVESTPGQGATFTILLPTQIK